MANQVGFGAFLIGSVSIVTTRPVLWSYSETLIAKSCLAEADVGETTENRADDTGQCRPLTCSIFVSDDQPRSNRSASMTFVHAATKSVTDFSFASSWA